MPIYRTPGGLAYSSLSVAMNAASGVTEGVDLEGNNGKVSAACALRVLTGGTAPTVAVTLETSPNNADWFTVAAVGTEMAAAAATREYRTEAVYHRFIRFSWVTTGGPTTATVDLYCNATA